MSSAMAHRRAAATKRTFSHHEGVWFIRSAWAGRGILGPFKSQEQAVRAGLAETQVCVAPQQLWQWRKTDYRLRMESHV